MVEVYPSNLTAFPTNTPSELHVFRHNSDTLGVKRAQVGILEERHQVRLSCLRNNLVFIEGLWRIIYLLQRENRSRLEA